MNLLWATLEECMHLSEPTLDAYLRERLDEDAQARAEEHLLICEECRLRVTKEEEFRSAFVASVTRPAASVTARPTWPRWVWLAPPVLACALGVLFVPRLTRPPLPPLEAASLTAARGSGMNTHATLRAAQTLQLDLDVRGLEAGSYQAELKDMRGQTLWTELVPVAGESQMVKIPQTLAPGTYRLSLLSSAHELAREYPFVIVPR